MMVFKAYTTKQAAKVVKVSPRRIAYWARQGVLVPSVLSVPGAPIAHSLYSFADLVGLRTLGILRDRYGLSLQSLRQAAEFLRQHSDQPWSELRFWVRGHDLLFRAPASDAMLSAGARGQSAITVELEPVASDVRRESELLNRRDPADIGKIERRRGVQGNQPVVKGTRVTVDTIYDFADAGYTAQQIVNEFPSLTLDDVSIVLVGRRAA